MQHGKVGHLFVRGVGRASPSSFCLSLPLPLRLAAVSSSAILVSTLVSVCILRLVGLAIDHIFIILTVFCARNFYSSP